MKSKKDKKIWFARYKSGAAPLRAEAVPIARHLNPGWELFAAEMLEEGEMERDGKRVEYHDLRVFVQATPPTQDSSDAPSSSDLNGRP